MRGWGRWSWVLIALFILSMLSYPTYEGDIHGWPINFVLSVGICLLYLIIYTFYIKDRLNRED